MSSVKKGEADFGVMPEMLERWSPYCFDDQTVPGDLLLQCLEATRWSASSYNEQPWYFLLSEKSKPDGFEKMLGCLLEANQVWAKYAGALLIAVSKENFSHNGTPNRVHAYDLGQAVAQLSLQATALGLQVHQMAGINLSRIRQEYSIPDGYVPQTAVAIGYAAKEPLPGQEAFAGRDTKPRTRKKISEFVFSEKWGTSFTTK